MQATAATAAEAHSTRIEIHAAVTDRLVAAGTTEELRANYVLGAAGVWTGLVGAMAAADGQTDLTECPACAMQMEHGTGERSATPLAVLVAALVGSPGDVESCPFQPSSRASLFSA